MRKINNFILECERIKLPIKIIKKIEKKLKEYNGKIYLVGGNVRDLILGNEIASHPDLVVNVEYEVLVKCLKKAKINFLEIGSKFDSLVVLDSGFKIDITCMRTDVETDGRWAKTQFTEDLVKDSNRRDFTFNSIYCDTNGIVYDPNNGVNDLKKKNVKFIGDIHSRINEDHLRILRFLRFSLLVSGNIEKRKLQICNQNFKKLKKLSFQRRIGELKLILLNTNLQKSSIVDKLKILIEASLESKLNFKNFSFLCKLESNHKNESFERRLKFLLRSKKKLPKLINLNAEKKLKRRLLKVVFFKDYSESEINYNLYKSEKNALIDKLMIDHSDNLLNSLKFNFLLKKINGYKKKKFPLRGDDLISLGFSPGKELGDVFEKVEIWWVKNNFEKNKRECINFSKKFLP